MTAEKFYEIFGDINERYIAEARNPAKRKLIRVWGSMAACLCILLAGLLMYGNYADRTPHPEQVQCPSPILEVSSVEEMEQYLDFKVPVLPKEVDTYIVLILDAHPTCARIQYADGSTFNMEYGTGDISGIYGGVFDREEIIHHVKVSFYKYTDMEGSTISYALWEKGGFTYSLSGEEGLAEEIESLLQ